MKHLTLQGFAARSLPIRAFENNLCKCANIQGLRKLSGSQKLREGAHFSTFHPVGACDLGFYNPNWSSLGNLSHPALSAVKDSFSCGSTISPGCEQELVEEGEVIALPWQGLGLANLSLLLGSALPGTVWFICRCLWNQWSLFHCSATPIHFSWWCLLGDFWRYPLPPAPSWQIIDSIHCS